MVRRSDRALDSNGSLSSRPVRSPRPCGLRPTPTFIDLHRPGFHLILTEEARAPISGCVAPLAGLIPGGHRRYQETLPALAANTQTLDGDGFSSP